MLVTQSIIRRRNLQLPLNDMLYRKLTQLSLPPVWLFAFFDWRSHTKKSRVSFETSAADTTSSLHPTMSKYLPTITFAKSVRSSENLVYRCCGLVCVTRHKRNFVFADDGTRFYSKPMRTLWNCRHIHLWCGEPQKREQCIGFAVQIEPN